jgi:hypothetical protein
MMKAAPHRQMASKSTGYMENKQRDMQLSISTISGELRQTGTRKKEF